MERVLQWLDDCEDLVFCLPMVWRRARPWLLCSLLFLLAAMLVT